MTNESVWVKRNNENSASYTESEDEFFSKLEQWQPIETAPRDGTVILLHDQFPWRKTVAGFYDRDETDFPWKFIDGTSELNGWHDDHTGPTHWMPLPEPPRKDNKLERSSTHE